jgi:ribonuclease Z
MPRHFDPSLVNDPFEDPGLYVDLVFERRALLFDLGDIRRLAPRKLLRVSDVFITHRHMDHFAGFDHLLRVLLGREKTLRLYGPPGTIDAVEHKLKAYTWNLIEGYDGELTLSVCELDTLGRMACAHFSGRSRFERRLEDARQKPDGLLIKETNLELRAATLDHGIPVLAFALQERAGINICRNKAEELGLAVGPWLRGFKEAVVSGAGDDALISVVWREPSAAKPDLLPLGRLKTEIMRLAKGRKIAYVVDCAFTEANQVKIVDLAADADLLFIEATFLDADAEIALARRHLTARQAGTLARRAGVKRLATLHYSPRYKGEGFRLAAEAQEAFLRG